MDNLIPLACFSLLLTIQLANPGLASRFTSVSEGDRLENQYLAQSDQQPIPGSPDRGEPRRDFS